MDDDEARALVERAAAGDEDAADALGQRYAAPLRKIVRRRLGMELRGRVDSEDLIQTTFHTALRALPNFDYRDEPSLLRWLAAIVEQKVCDAARRHLADRRDVRREQSLDAAANVPGCWTNPAQGAVRKERSSRLFEAIGRLPVAERRVIEFHSFQEMDFGQVAEQLGLTDKNAARRVFLRALKRMGDLIASE